MRIGQETNMRIGLIGATGAVGSNVLTELVSRGHDVVAIARQPEVVAATEKVQPLALDVNDTAALGAALAGLDAVISAFNPGWTAPELHDRFMAGSRSIQAAVKDAGVPRLLVVGGAGSLYGDDGRQLIEGWDMPAPIADGVRAARDYHAEILSEDELDWVFLSPPPGYGSVDPGGPTGSYRVGAESPVVDSEGVSTISGPDLALAIVDEIESPRHHRERFTVGY